MLPALLLEALSSHWWFLSKPTAPLGHCYCPGVCFRAGTNFSLWSKFLHDLTKHCRQLLREGPGPGAGHRIISSPAFLLGFWLLICSMEWSAYLARGPREIMDIKSLLAAVGTQAMALALQFADSGMPTYKLFITGNINSGGTEGRSLNFDGTIYCCVTLGKYLNLSDPPISCIYYGDNYTTS